MKGVWWLLARLSGGEWRYVWAAIETRVDCWLYGFHGNNACGSLPGAWAEVGTFGERNRIERWFRTMKARIRRFFNNFPAGKSQSSKSNSS